MSDHDQRPPGDDGRPDADPDRLTGPDGAGEPPTVPTSERPGRMRFQDETTTPREPSLAERRARELAIRREREERAALEAADEARRRKRKRILIGTGVSVGIVALIAVGYAAAAPDDEVEARCVDDNNIVVDDDNCVTPAASSGYHGGFGGFFPIFLGGGGRQYHYNYGGTGSIGQPATGGTTAVPREGTQVKSGTSGKSISRGGLGVGSSGSSSGS